MLDSFNRGGGVTLSRRRLIQEQNKEWDFEWDYTMGLISDNGCRKSTSGDVSETLVSNGVSLHTMSTGNTLSYIFIYAPVEKCETGVMEIDFTLISDPMNGAATAANFRPSFGNDDNFVSFLHNRNSTSRYLKFHNGGNYISAGTNIASYQLNTRYLLRITLDKNRKLKLERNGSVLFDGTAPVTQYGNSVRLCQQGWNGSETIIHAWRIKYNRTE